MFSQYFGEYLIQNNVITEEQLKSLVTYQDDHRAKLGIIAVSEGLLTSTQADELNRLQKTTDKRFGDLAVSKEYLTEQDITHLLDLQGNPYLVFLQALEETGILSVANTEQYIADYQKSLHMSNSCLNAIKNCDIDTVIRTFVTNAPDSSIPLLAQSLRNLIRFVSTHLAIHSSRTAQSYSAKHMCLQRTNGASDGFLMFASNDDSLLPIACKYGQWDFTTMDEDSYDAICEFINCINGLYASQASQQDLELDMLPPEFYSNATCTVEQGDLTIIPILLNQKQFDIIIGTHCIPSFK